MRKILVLIFALFVGLTLASCDKKEKLNTNVPTGSLGDTAYATLGDVTLTEKELYNQMRSTGYSIFVSEIAKTLIPYSQLDATNAETQKELKALINTDCFGTDDEEEISKMKASTKEDSITAYVDNMKLLGVNITEDDIYTGAYDYYKPSLAQKQYAKSLITTSTSKYYHGNEFQTENGTVLLDDNGKEIANAYHISEEDIEEYFESNYKEDSSFEAIIVGFRTVDDLRNAVVEAGGTFTNGKVNPSSDVKAFFSSLFDTVYGDYKEANNHVLTDEDIKSLPAAVTKVLDNLEVSEYTAYPVEAGDLVYLVYSISEKVEQELTTELEETIKNEIIDNFVTSSFISSMVNNLVKESDITIYDPVYSALYAASNADFKQLTADEWKDEYKNNVAKVGENYITVDAFNKTLEQRIGVTTTMDYFINKALLASGVTLDEDELEDIEKQYKTQLESFNNNGVSSYPASIGEDNFKFLYYGSTNEEDILNHYKAQLIWEKTLEQYPANFIDNAYYFGQRYEQLFFNLSVKHVLLFVDYDMDGTPDDPELFRNKLAEPEKFDAAVKELMNAFLAEVHYVIGTDETNEKLTTLEKALTWVANQYAANGEILHTTADDTWASLKKYNIGIKVEDLGEVNNSNASQYVTEFGVGVQALYQELSEKEGYKMGDDYIAESISSVADLIQTTYGFHILGVYDAGTITSAKYEVGSDTNKVYQNIKVTWNGVEETVENAYSSEVYPSKNQLKIYFAKSLNNETVKGLPTSAQNYIANIYSTIMNRYNDTDFQNIYLAQKFLVGKLTFADAANGAKLTEFLNIQKRQLDEYKDFSENGTELLGGWWEKFLPVTE